MDEQRPPDWRPSLSKRETQVMGIVFVVAALLMLGAILLSLG